MLGSNQLARTTDTVRACVSAWVYGKRGAKHRSKLAVLRLMASKRFPLVISYRLSDGAVLGKEF